MKSTLLALAFVATLAHAQGGVQLLSPAQAAASEVARNNMLKERPGTLSVTPVAINANAMASNVISVTVEGKTYSFVKVSIAGNDGWYGTLTGKPDGGTYLSLVMVDSKVPTGQIAIEGQHYQLLPGALVSSGSGPFVPGDQKSGQRKKP